MGCLPAGCSGRSYKQSLRFRPAGRKLALPVGEYEVRAAKRGFQDSIRSGIYLVVGQEASVDLRLQAGTVKSEIVVKGDAPMVSSTTKDISGLVGEKAIKDLQFRAEIFQSAESCEFQYAKPHRVYAANHQQSGWAVRHGGRHDQHHHQFAPGATRAEPALVAPEPPLARGSL